MKTPRTLAAALAVAAIALAGCTSGASAPTATEEKTAEHKGEAVADSDETAVVSEPQIPRGKSPKNPPMQVIVGSSRYDVATADNIDGALSNLLTEKSNAFLREHYLRRDRWAGSWYVKKGEMDAYRQKVTPALFAEVDTNLALLEADLAKYGLDSEKWPTGVREAAAERTSHFERLFFNHTDTGTGTGDIVYRRTGGDLYRGSKAEWEGAPITYGYVEAFRDKGSDGPVRYVLWQSWQKVGDEWRIADAGWDTPS